MSKKENQKFDFSNMEPATHIEHTPSICLHHRFTINITLIKSTAIQKIYLDSKKNVAARNRMRQPRNLTYKPKLSIQKTAQTINKTKT